MKQKVKITIKTEEETIEFDSYATYEEDYLYFVEEDSDKTVNIFNFKDKTLKRDNDKMYLELKFDLDNKTKNILMLKDIKENLDLEIINNELNINEKEINIRNNLNNIYYNFRIVKDDSNEYN